MNMKQFEYLKNKHLKIRFVNLIKKQKKYAIIIRLLNNIKLIKIINFIKN
ncbi:MAG: hypothetical protein AM1032_000314 [Mycoplasmataceae bacterium]|nr:MAG: hypothetical protein AM1032_000314 [Mycoplasmataceae bacterium]